MALRYEYVISNSSFLMVDVDRLIYERFHIKAQLLILNITSKSLGKKKASN